VRNKRAKGPKQGILSSPSKLKNQKTSIASNASKSTGASNGLGPKKKVTDVSLKSKVKGETSFIIEEMMDQGIAKGDITLSDGTGTDNMTCIIVFFRDPDDAKKENEINGKEEE
jgi:hypothetical protein